MIIKRKSSRGVICLFSFIVRSLIIKSLDLIFILKILVGFHSLNKNGSSVSFLRIV